MTTTWTSIEAFHNVMPVLPKKRREVLASIFFYQQVAGSWPTGLELARYMKREVRNVTPRLNELRVYHRAIHKGPVAICTVSGYKAETWVPGPERPEDLPIAQAASRVSQVLVERLDLLRQKAQDVFYEPPLARRILNVSERRLTLAYQALGYGRNGTGVEATHDSVP